MFKRQNILTALLVLFALFNFSKWALHFKDTPYHPIDFRGCYLSARAYWEGMDPYSYSDQNILWERLPESKGEWKMIQRGVYSTPLYPPQFVFFFGAYGLLSFQQAIWLQWILNILCLALIAWCICRLNPKIKPWLVILLILAFRGTWYALDTGQPMIQVFACCLYAIAVLKNRPKSRVPGLIMGFVSFKFTLLIPFVAYLLVTKHYKTIFMIAGISLFMNCAVLLADPLAATHLQSWSLRMSEMNDYLHSPGPLNGLSALATSISIPFSYFLQLPESFSSGFLIVATRILLPLLPYILIWVFRKDKNPFMVLFLASLSGLCFGHHLVYDILTTLCLRMLLVKEGQKISVMEALLLLLLVIPLGKLSVALGIEWLDLLPAMALFVYFLTSLYTYTREKKVPESTPVI